MHGARPGPRRCVEGSTRRVFGGAPELLLTHLVNHDALEEDDLRRMSRLLDERLGDRTGRHLDADRD